MKPFRWILMFAVTVVAPACGRVGNADTQVEKPVGEIRNSGEVVLGTSQQSDFGIVVETVNLTNQPEILEVPGEINLIVSGHWHIGVLASGRIEKVNVSLGDFVREGDILARMHS